MADAASGAGWHEFVCCECGQAVVALIGTTPFCLCATCIMLPGWHSDPTLRARLGPNLPPLPPKAAAGDEDTFP